MKAPAAGSWNTTLTLTISNPCQFLEESMQSPLLYMGHGVPVVLSTKNVPLGLYTGHLEDSGRNWECIHASDK